MTNDMLTLPDGAGFMDVEYRARALSTLPPHPREYRSHFGMRRAVVRLQHGLDVSIVDQRDCECARVVEVMPIGDKAHAVPGEWPREVDDLRAASAVLKELSGSEV